MATGGKEQSQTNIHATRWWPRHTACRLASAKVGSHVLPQEWQHYSRVCQRNRGSPHSKCLQVSCMAESASREPAMQCTNAGSTTSLSYKKL